MTRAEPMHHAASRYRLLDGLRGILALAVVVSHFTATSGRRELFASSALAVDFFFCLSGFVIAHAYEAKLRAGLGLGAFMAARLRRLYPMYLVGLVLGVFAVWRLHTLSPVDVSYGTALGAVVLNAAYLPFLNGVGLPVHGVVVVGALFPFNNPSWSLFFEMAVNVVYACIVRASDSVLLVVVALAATGMVIGAETYGLPPGWSTRDYPGGICRTAYAFFSGVLLHRWLARGAAWGPSAAIAVTVAVTALTAMPRGPNFCDYWLACAIVAVPALVALAARCDVGGGRLAAWCDLSGRLSYPMYCLHYPLLMVVGAPAATSAAYLAHLAAYLAATFLLSHLLLAYFDEPLRARLALRAATTRPSR